MELLYGKHQSEVLRLKPHLFRSFLKERLVSRFQKNPAYSLRAFAKSVGVSHASLSQVLNGRRPLSLKTFEQICSSLALSPKEKSQFLEIPGATKNQPTLEQLEQDQFEVISDWKHFALLQLMQLKGQPTDVKSLAFRLGLSSHEVLYSLERLQKVQLAEAIEAKRGFETWKIKGSGSTVFSGLRETTSARQKLQRQMFQKSFEAIEDIPFDHRYHAGITMTVKMSQLNIAREAIRNFCQEMNQLLDAGEKNDEVFHLSVALFPLTKIRKE